MGVQLNILRYGEAAGVAERTPDEESEARLEALRREAETTGRVEGLGVRPSGAPFPSPPHPPAPLARSPQWALGQVKTWAGLLRR